MNKKNLVDIQLIQTKHRKCDGESWQRKIDYITATYTTWHAHEQTHRIIFGFFFTQQEKNRR